MKAQMTLSARRWLLNPCRFLRNRASRLALCKVKQDPEKNPLDVAVRAMGIRRTDTIIPGRGELAQDPTTRLKHMRFTRPGDDGEFHLQFRVEYTPPYRSANAAS